MPRGWAELVALGPVDPPHTCGRCGGPAVVRSLQSVGPDVWLCAACPPGPGEWGHGLDWTPRPCRAPGRCYCGRCDVGCPTPAGETVVDQQAIASGKRRASPERYREARAAVG